jgi:hypothetical protein
MTDPNEAREVLERIAGVTDAISAETALRAMLAFASRPAVDREAVIEDCALQIDSAYEATTDYPCTCQHDETGCPACNAWDAARSQVRGILKEALSTREAVADDGWQGIETAPRNPVGTMGLRGDLDIDLWHKQQGRVANCFWWAEFGAWFARSGGRAFNMGDDTAFSHWRPLPAPPALALSAGLGGEGK